MMDPNRRLRYYRSAKPWLAGVGCSLIFVAGGALASTLPHASHPEDSLIGVFCMAFFGFCALAFVIFALRDRREPLFTLTPAGIQTHYMRAGHQIVSWVELAALGIARGKQYNKKIEPELYLIARSRPGALNHALEDWEDLDALDEAGTPTRIIMLPLNQFFATTNTKRNERWCEELLDEIAETFAPELDLYKITVEREIKPLSRQ